MAKRVDTTSLQFEISINGERKVLKTLKQVRAERRTLIKQLETQQLTQSEYNKKIAELGKLNAIIKDHKNQISGAGRAYSTATKGATLFKNVVSKVGTAIKTALGPIGLIIAAGTALFNITREAAVAAQEMQKTTERVNQLTGLVGDDLQKASASATALSKTFETDLTAGIDAANSAANAFTKEGEELGPVFQESLDGIGQRLAGLDGKGDEFLSQIAQYAPQAEQAGLSMDRFFNIVTAGINRGVDTDKLIDSVKEFNIRIKDLSTGQKDSLDQVFGKQFTDQIVKDVEEGTITSIDALDKIAVKTRELGTDSAAAQKVVSNLFGGPGEDATAKYLTLISDIGDELSDVVDVTNVYVRRRLELLNLENEAADATARLSFLTDGAGNAFQKIGLTIKTFFVNQLANVIEFIQYFPDYFKAATSSGKVFANTLISSFEKILKVGLFPFVKAIEAITGTEIKLPRFQVEDNPFDAVEAKIKADREAFAESQRQQTLSAEGKTQEASRLAALKAQQRRFKELDKAAAAERKRREQEELKAAQAIEDLRLALLEEGLDKQIEILEVQTARRIAVLKGNETQISEQTLLLQEKLAADIQKLREKDSDRQIQEALTQGKKLQKAEEKAYQERQKALSDQLKDDTLAITQQLIEDVETGLVDAVDAEATLQDRLLESYKIYLEKKKVLALESGKDITEIELEEEKQRFDELLKKAEEREKAQKEKDELKDTAVQSAFELAEGLAEKQFSKELARIDEKRSALEDAEAQALENAGDNAAARTAIQKKFAAEREKIEIEQAKKEKQIALKRSLIDFALALFKAIASAPPPINLGAIAAQTALLTLPQGILSAVQFGDGGKLPRAGKGGRPVGPSHRDGHIYLVDGKTGKVSGTIEGGEPILSNATYANNQDIIDQLLYSSMYQGGRRIFGNGGFLDSPNTTPSSEVDSNTKANPELTILIQKFDVLTAAYQAGKTVLVGDKEANLFGEMLTEREKDRFRRSL